MIQIVLEFYACVHGVYESVCECGLCSREACNVITVTKYCIKTAWNFQRPKSVTELEMQAKCSLGQ